MANAEERYEEIRKLLEKLAERNERAPVIVEGERDVRALRALGIDGTVLALHRGTSVFRLCETLAAEHEEVVILTDWDVRGGQLARLLRDGLAANGVRYDEDLRARLAALCGREVRSVEGLPTYLENLRPRSEEGRRRVRSNRAWYARPRR